MIIANTPQKVDLEQFKKALKGTNPQRITTIDPKLSYSYNLLRRNDSLIMELIKDVKGSSKVLKTSLTPEDALYETRASENYTHQLIQMVHYAYYNHFPLSFSPDDIQLLITQGFCTHIKQNAEKFRKKFVEHQGQKELIVQVQDSDYNNYNWPQVIQQFSSLIKKNIGEERYNLCVHNYSTTTETIKTCYEISLMDTMQKYFKYTMMVGCGISKVKLLGTLEDWLKVRENLENLREVYIKVNKLSTLIQHKLTINWIPQKLKGKQGESSEQKNLLKLASIIWINQMEQKMNTVINYWKWFTTLIASNLEKLREFELDCWIYKLVPTRLIHQTLQR